MNNHRVTKYSAFTLIELLVSTTIILLLILAAAPSFDKVQSKNRIRGGAEILQNCVSRAKSLALAPETNSSNLVSYLAILYDVTDPTKPNQCEVYEKTSGTPPILTLVDTYKLSNSVRISHFIVNGATLAQSTYTFEFENQNHGLATRVLDPSGNPDPNNEMTAFSVQDEKLNCQQLKFFYETGEILLEKLGIMNSSGLCIGS